MIPLFKTKIHQSSIDNVVETLNSGWVGLGPKVEKFEKAFANYIGNNYAVAFNSCTEALRVALILAYVGREDKVITSPLTFVGVNHVLLQQDYVPLFADIDPYSGSMSYESMRLLCREHHPEAILAMHYGGYPINLDLLYEIGKEYKCEIIEDCAHACGASWDGKKVGARAKFACYSFHAVKNMPTGDGGMLVTNDEEVAENAKKLRWFGIDKSTADRSKQMYGWRYEVDMVGFKSYMNDITAAIGLGQLPHLDSDNARRHEIYTAYKNAFPDHMLGERKYSESSHHLCVFLAKDRAQKENIIHSLTYQEIQYGVHYLPNYYYPMYDDVVKFNDCIETEAFYNRCISLPCHLYLTDDDIQQVVDAIRGWI